MEIIFSHPCDNTIKIKRRVPKFGTTKKLKPLDNGEFEWDFTNYGYHFNFTYKNDGKHKMLVCSGNPNDCLNWSSFNDNVEIKN